MRKLWPFLALAAIIFFVSIIPQRSIAEEKNGATRTQSATWGSIKAMYLGDGVTVSVENPAPLKATQSEGVTSSPSEPAWANPIAREAIEKYHLSSTDILAVQRVVMLNNSTPIDSADVVVTEKQWYYKDLVDPAFSTNPPSLPLTTEMDIYGSNVEIATWAQECWNIHWAVTFYMPVCFYELVPGSGQFDGIIDAWAPRPNCSPVCNGGLCALYMCGDAWDGAGYLGWWNFHQSCVDQRASKKVGKLVQKRWLHTWQLCYGYSDPTIAHLVRARIRF